MQVMRAPLLVIYALGMLIALVIIAVGTALGAVLVAFGNGRAQRRRAKRK